MFHNISMKNTNIKTEKTLNSFNSESDYEAYLNEIECASHEQWKHNRTTRIWDSITENKKNDINHKSKDINDF